MILLFALYWYTVFYLTLTNRIVIKDADHIKYIVDLFESQKLQKLAANAEDESSIYTLEFYQDDMEQINIRILYQDRLYFNQLLYQIKGNNDILSYIDQYADQIIAEKNLPQDIYITVKEESVSFHGATIAIVNSSAYEYFTGEYYLLEQFANNDWMRMQPIDDVAFNAIGYFINGLATLEMNIDWTDYYGVLKPGRYRVGKNVADGDQAYIMYAEFVIK